MEKDLFRRLSSGIREIAEAALQVQRDKATGVLEFELKELENIFIVLLMGSMVGLPSPPAAIAVELLPYLEEELKIMISRADMAQDPLGTLMGMLGVD